LQTTWLIANKRFTVYSVAFTCVGSELYLLLTIEAYSVFFMLVPASLATPPYIFMPAGMYSHTNLSMTLSFILNKCVYLHLQSKVR